MEIQLPVGRADEMYYCLLCLSRVGRPPNEGSVFQRHEGGNLGLQPTSDH